AATAPAAAPVAVRREAPRPTPPREEPFVAAPRPAADSGSLLNLLFGFQGRMPRSAYGSARIASYLVFMIVLFGSYRLAMANRHDVSVVLGLALCVFFVSLVWIWTSLAMQVKRWHDRGKSGVWVLVSLVPLVGPFWMFVELVFLDGVRGPNAFGPDPRGDPNVVFEA
ncbi:MAG TPA: DUF805 domain-containing protein, partial [Caulobacteraceae bacterium]|nr:DUF805 domain-containing protein [Caulobacteraceae bacterium]